MALIDVSPTQRRYPGPLYPRVPELHMPGGDNVATNLAKLVVGMAVDHRAIYAVRTSAQTYPVGMKRAWELRQSAAHGFDAMVWFHDAPLDQGPNITELYYVQMLGGEVGLHTLARNTHDEVDNRRMLYWIPDNRGVFQPRASLDAGDRDTAMETADLARFAAHYAVVTEQILSDQADIPLHFYHSNLQTLDHRPLPVRPPVREN